MSAGDAAAVAAAAAASTSQVIPASQRTHPRVLCLFDVDGTLSLARQSATPAMILLLSSLRKHVVTGFLGGSNLGKIMEQLRSDASPDPLRAFDWGFAENGLTAFRDGKTLASQSFIEWLGEEKYKKLVRFVLRYIADLDIPIMRGTFIEFRNGMINVSPIGRDCSLPERLAFQTYDDEHQIRSKFVEVLQKEFADYGLTFAIGGQISFDIFPNGWDKTYALRHIDPKEYDEIHFFGDKTHKGGNDHEIFEDARTIGHTVKNPEDTMRQLKELFDV
ncbi:eukaryotic phosphomannomutase [Ceraceosorus guamensis]|uniref:Phosphomannomutase n=1 Tax=Ceraceosorus guamensis TaxID=1522189 RepID=A0A316VNF8_9BASI|nr:eukaryotic phosphomannomutase [Ceraceosorus guamensis]PWN39169.1 eukaryotic phosphomannomutase [Ceraceosorus guamensis]